IGFPHQPRTPERARIERRYGDSMKAVLCKAWGPPETLVVEEVPDPVPGPGQVLIDVKAAGVNFPDTLIIEKKYQFVPELPFSPGGEVAGIVEAAGEGVTAFKPGDRVLGSIGWGGFAEKAVAEAGRVMPIPGDMPFDVASAFVLAYGTSLYALKDRARLQAGETLLVLGAAGGVGIAAVEIGKAMGARVIAAASSDDKLALCRERGADELINYGTEDLRERIKALTDGKGPDVIYDPVGGAMTEAAFRSIGWDGRHLVIGFAARDLPTVPPKLALLERGQLG